jgi:hypothetical protein
MIRNYFEVFEYSLSYSYLKITPRFSHHLGSCDSPKYSPPSSRGAVLAQESPFNAMPQALHGQSFTKWALVTLAEGLVIFVLTISSLRSHRLPPPPRGEDTRVSLFETKNPMQILEYSALFLGCLLEPGEVVEHQSSYKTKLRHCMVSARCFYLL